MNPPGSHQKTTIGTIDRLVAPWYALVAPWYAFGDGVAIISTKSIIALVYFPRFLDEEIFAEFGIDRNHRATICPVAYHFCLAMI